MQKHTNECVVLGKDRVMFWGMTKHCMHCKYVTPALTAVQATKKPALLNC